ncbi:MAG: putative phage abortive infection protein [Proteiniphilum sp.]
MKRTDKVILPICIYLILIGLLGWFVWGHQRSFSFLLPIDFDGFGALGDFVGGIFGTLFAALAVYFAWMTFKKETIKTRFYEMLKSHRENVARIQISDIDVFGKYIAVLLEIYVTLLQKLTGKGYRDEDIFKLSYLFFFYGTELNSKTINTLLKKENEKLIDSEDVECVKLYFSTNNISLMGYANDLGIYFRQLYQTVTFIDRQNSLWLSYNDKYEYIKSLRVCLNVNEQYLLFLNSLSTLGMVWEMSKEKDNEKLITKYNLLKNIPESCKENFKNLNFEDKYPHIYYEYMGAEKKEERKKWEKKYF